MDKDSIDSLTQAPGYSRPVSRRLFLKRSAVSGGVLAGAMMLPPHGVSASTTQPEQNLVLVNFSLFDGKSRNLIENRAIVVENGRIREVEARRSPDQYRGYRLVDLGGRTVLPGLIDNHVHITVPFVTRVNPGVLMDLNSQIELNFKNCLLSGVTTVRDVGGFPGKINKFRKMADDRKILGPRVISSLSPIAAREGERFGSPEHAPYFTNPVLKWLIGGNYAERATNIREIETACHEMLDLGAQWIKTIYQAQTHTAYPRKLPVHADEGYRKILEIGRKNGVKCALHQPFVKGFMKGIEFGYHTLEHTPKDGIIPDSAVDQFIQQDMAILPTLMIYNDFLILEELKQLVQQHGSYYLLPSPMEQVLEKIDRNIELSGANLTEADIRPLGADPGYIRKMYPNAAANIAKLHRMGATIGIGTDIGGSFASFFGRYSTELKLMTGTGISNIDVLTMATSTNARIIERQDQIGTIEKGRLADIIAVQGNPLLDIAAMDQVDLVIKGGRIVKAEGISVSQGIN